MAEAAETTGVSQEQITEATRLGWSPKESFKGNPDLWVDADAYLERAQTVMPILKKQNQSLMSDLTELRQRDATREQEVKALKAALKAVEDSQAEDLDEQVEDAKVQLEADIEAASEAGDHRRVAKLTVELTELVTAEKVKKLRGSEEEPGTTRQQPPPLSDDFKSWQSQNDSWYGKDADKTAQALAFGQAIAQTTGLKGEAFFSELDKRLDRYYGTGRRGGGQSKVEGGGEGGGSGGGSGSGGGGGKSYSDLPKDAKDACERLVRRMVGEGKPHKDKTSWQKSYAKTYFSN